MKILGSDYDGTLNHGGINDVKLSAIQKWREAGHKFGIISGRDMDFCKNLLQQFPQLQLDFFAACNGGYISDGNGSLIYEAQCKEVSVSQLAKDLLALGCKFINIIGKKHICVVARIEDCPSYVSEGKFQGEENCLYP